MKRKTVANLTHPNMTPPIQCELFVPAPPSITLHQEDFPALRSLLRPAQLQQREAMTPAAWLCRRFGIKRQQDMPSAPYAALGDGLPAQQGYWLHADPISLLLQGDSFLLAEAAATLEFSQSRRLVETLNTHFADCGMRFYVATPRHWYLCLTLPPALHTHEFTEVLSHDMQDFLPRGRDALHWLRWLNELQMLLHDHPVNIELETQGLLPVHSVWLWGGGNLVAGPALDLCVWADDALLRGLALASACKLFALPQTAEAWLTQAAGKAHFVALPTLSLAIARDWLATLYNAVHRGRIALTLHLARQQVSSYTLDRRDFLKFWRQARRLEEYFG